MKRPFLVIVTCSALLVGCSDKSTDSNESSSSSVENQLSSSSTDSLLSSSSAVPADSLSVIDNFEDGDATNSMGGYWYQFSDNGGGGQSSIIPENWEDAFVTDSGYQSKGMFSVKVNLLKAEYKWAPYYAFATLVPKNEKINPSSYAGISYWHKGVAHTFRIDIPEVLDYDNHLVEVPAHADWTLVNRNPRALRGASHTYSYA